MSFQELDLKSSRVSVTRQPFVLAFKSKLQIKLLLKLAVASAAITLLGFSAHGWEPTTLSKAAESTPKLQQLHYKLALPDAKKAAIKPQVKLVTAEISIENNEWRIITIKSGDTLGSIFSDNGLSATTTHYVAALNDHTKALRYIKPGQKIHLLLDEHQSLLEMKYVYGITKTLEIHRNEDQSLSSQIVNYKLDALPVFRQGVIKSSLFEAAAAGDIPDSIIMDLADIFGWDIDFSLDIRRGDRFGVVYNELYKDGVKIKSGEILAAEFINNGKLYKAVYYTNPKGEGDYYSEDGKSMRKAFLRSPVKFARISSKFSLKRWHPVLSKWRSHKGVDYAAARGTPIRASGDGKIVLAGRKGGYGKAIFIQHGGRYRTVYGHLNSYAKGIRVGKKVKQGQIIGYVGSTGLATGPHLHYEFRVNGTHRNPLTVRLPEAKPVHPSNLPHFKENTQAYLSMLQVMGNTLAINLN
ncbi:MAG: murein DD-endopeptidase MepM/ murein hydrolase activator NlpD [Oleispira sp.]|jgi:murein DD-endopeptidase MepM/ murein hydrolase activator NlpD